MIEIVPKDVGLESGEAKRRLHNGWRVVPGVTLAVGSETQTADLWIPPIAMIPEAVLVASMFEAEQRGADILALEVICRRIYGVGYAKVKEMVQGTQ